MTAPTKHRSTRRTRSVADRIHTKASAMYAEGQSHAEIAKALGVSAATVGRSLRRGAGKVAEPVERPQVLYRMYDQAGRLLYVGISMSPMGRFKQHSGNQPWWSDVARIDLEHFQTREQVMEAERIAVRDEKPRHNIRLTGEDRLSEEARLRRAAAGRKGGAKSAQVRRAKTIERIARILGE